MVLMRPLNRMTFLTSKLTCADPLGSSGFRSCFAPSSAAARKEHHISSAVVAKPAKPAGENARDETLICHTLFADRRHLHDIRAVVDRPIELFEEGSADVSVMNDAVGVELRR